MSFKRWSLVAVVVVIVVGVGLAGSPVTSGESAAAESQPAPPPADLVVTLEHVGGKVDRFQDELVRMELILTAAGRLDQVHLIAKTGPEADTHIWYNVDNLVSVRYQFLAITGKGKVSVRTIAPPNAKPPADAPKPQVPPLEPEDYR